MTLLTMMALGLALVPFGGLAVTRPMRTIVPLYAGTMPVASVVDLQLPLPDPFNTLSSALGGAAIMALLAHVALYGRGRIPTLPVAAWLAFLVWAAATTFWAINPGAGVRTLTIAAPLVLLMVAVALLPADRGDLDVMRLAIILSGAVVGAYALFLLVSGSALPIHGTSERFSIATSPDDTNPNIVAASLLLPLALSLERLLLGGSHWLSAGAWRWIGGTSVFLTTIAIILTASRGGMISTVTVVALTLLFCARIPEYEAVARAVIARICLFIVLLVPILFTFTAFFPLSASARNTIANSLERIVGAEERGDSGRTEIWTSGLLACHTHCLLGVGFGGFPTAYDDVQAFSGALKDVGPSRPAHNVFLGIVVETGVVGLALLATALALEWRTLSSVGIRHLTPSLRGALLGLLVASIFLSAIWFKYFWLVFTMIRIAEGAAMEEADELESAASSFGAVPRFVR